MVTKNNNLGVTYQIVKEDGAKRKDCNLEQIKGTYVCPSGLKKATFLVTVLVSID